MNMKKSNILIIALALIAAAAAYWYFFTGTETASPLTATGDSGNASEAQFQTLVSELQPVTFDTGIFTDPRFMALIDLSTPVTPEQAGRPDPFAPVPGVSTK
jgi:hypothetical protein